jgi:hypothetical protein
MGSGAPGPGAPTGGGDPGLPWGPVGPGAPVKPGDPAIP